MSVNVRRSRNGKAWEVDIIVTTPDGTEHRERKTAPVSSKTASREWGVERERWLALHGKSKPREATTLQAFFPRYIKDYCEAERQKPSTIIQKKRIFEHYLKKPLGSKQIDKITGADVQQLKASLRHLSPKTANNVIVVLSTMLQQAVDLDVIERMSCKSSALKLVKVPDVGDPQYYEPHVYERLVAAAKEIDPRIELLVLLGGDAGLRCGEIIALEQTDIDLGRKYLTVRRSEWEGHLTVPKGGKARKVPLSNQLKAALARNRHLRTDRVLWRDDAFPKVTQVLLAKWMRRAQRRAGVKVTGGLHILRHTFCSRLAMAGASPKAIQELAGHKDLRTTLRYMHLSPGARSETVGLLDRGADLKAEGEVHALIEDHGGAGVEQTGTEEGT